MTNSVDTWQDLERRFHEIGNLPTTNVLLEFTEGKPSEPIQWTLSGVKKGECHITLIGGDRAAAEQSRKYRGNEHADGDVMCDLMRRAGNLLVPHNPENIWEGADLFVAITVKKQRYFVCTDGERTFFPNAGRTFGTMAGQMVLRSTDNADTSWTPEVEAEGRKINKTPPSASTLDQQRLKFYDAQKAINSTLRYKRIAAMWCRQNPGETCDETAFKQSCYRARKNVTK